MSKKPVYAPDPVDDNPYPNARMVGYARVSMSDQSNARQIDELIRAGCAKEDIFTDSASGRDMNRPGWKDVSRFLRPGDTLVVLSVDRLGRDLIKVIQTVRDLDAREIRIKVLSGLIDTTTPNGRLMLAFIAAMAQWERELIVERTKHGLEVAREQGRVGGRAKQISDAEIADVRSRKGKGESVADMAKKLKVSPNALYKRLKEEAK